MMSQLDKLLTQLGYGARQEWHCLKRVFGSCGGGEFLEIRAEGRSGNGAMVPGNGAMPGNEGMVP